MSLHGLAGVTIGVPDVDKTAAFWLLLVLISNILTLSQISSF